MVTVSKKIRITDLTNFPVSVDGTTGVPATGGGGGYPYPYYYQPFPPFSAGIPGTEGAGTDPIVDPHPGSCDPGYVKDSQGYCVPVSSLPACPTGQVRDVVTGLCTVTIPTGGGGGGTGIGQLYSATVPPSSVQGETIKIQTVLKNSATTNSYSFGARILIPSINIDTFSPLIPIGAGATLLVETTIVLPGSIAIGAVAGTIQVVRQVSTVPASVVIDDTEPFTLNIVTNVPYPCSSLPACPTGYHRDAACNCISDIPTGGGGTATITLSAAVVQQGHSISITATGFGPSEVIDFTATVGTTLVASEPKATNSAGTVVLNSLTFSPVSPLGIATILAKGRTSNKSATGIVTVTSATGPPPTTPPPTGAAVITTNKSTYSRNETITISGSGFKPGENVDVRVRIEESTRQNKTVKANSTGGISTTLKSDKKGNGYIKAEGLSSHRVARRNIKVV